MSAAIKIQNISKMYRLGEVGTGTIRDDFARAWAKLRGKEDPFQKVGVVNRRDRATDDDYVWALRDINFEVEQGEVLGIIGRNGAGKSTLLKLLSRITSPTTGRIRARGRIASLLEVGTGFHPELTGRENVYLNGALLGMTRREVTRRLEDIVGFSGCAQYIDTPVKRYSSGMMVRLGFSVAAHLDCEILVVDEVLAVGDYEFQKSCLRKMEAVATEGCTIIYVSHNMATVRTLCTRGLLLLNGQVQCDADSETVINMYLAKSRETAVSYIAFDTPQDPSGHIGSLEFLDSEGQPRAEYRIGETWTMRITIHANAPIKDAIAAVGILNADGIAIRTLYTKSTTLSPGIYNAEFALGIPLNSNDLSFCIGLTGEDRTLFYKAGVGHVSIINAAIGEQPRATVGTGILVAEQVTPIYPAA